MRRYENGFDIKTDERYNVWLTQLTQDGSEDSGKCVTCIVIVHTAILFFKMLMYQQSLKDPRLSRVEGN